MLRSLITLNLRPVVLMLSKSFDTLIPDVYALFDGADLSSAVGEFGDKLGVMLVEKIKEYENERVPSLRMSNLGKPLRQLWYDLKGYKGEPLTSETKLKFMYGNLIEEMFLFLAIQSGHDVQDIQYGIEVDGVRGHLDATIDGVLVDVKSCSPFSYNKFKTGEVVTNDPFGYIAQLSGYQKAKGAERAAFIAIDKVHGKICAFELPKKVSEAYDVSKRIQTVREAVRSDTAPARCFSDEPDQKSGNRKLGINCSYCSHKSRCWSDANDGQGLKIYFYSTGPRWLTKVVKEPRVNKEEETYESFPIRS